MPQREYNFYVYILGSRSRNLYIGLTNNLRRRIAEHREHRPGAHTAAYNIDRLLYFERYQYVRSAIRREKELKDFNRALKVALIEKINPTWQDLAAEWTTSIAAPEADSSATPRDDHQKNDNTNS